MQRLIAVILCLFFLTSLAGQYTMTKKEFILTDPDVMEYMGTGVMNRNLLDNLTQYGLDPVMFKEELSKYFPDTQEDDTVVFEGYVLTDAQFWLLDRLVQNPNTRVLKADIVDLAIALDLPSTGTIQAIKNRILNMLK